MTGATSNAAAVSAKLEALVRAVDFTHVGASQSLGRDCLAEVVQGILADAIGGQKSPDGATLAANHGKYGEAKRSRGLPVGIGMRRKKASTGSPMLSEVEVAGTQDITPDTATLTYGRSELAKRKAQWFTAGSKAAPGLEPSGAANQPPRPFFGLSADSREAVMVVCRAFVADLIRKEYGP